MVVASGDLDEHSMRALDERGARIDVWGIGTRLATGHPDAALGGVYKLGALRRDDGGWRLVSKRSEEEVKSSIPGILNIRRFENDEGYLADVICDEREGQRPVSGPVTTLDGLSIALEGKSKTLLQPLMRAGGVLERFDSAHRARRRAMQGLERLPEVCRALRSPQPYPVALEPELNSLRRRLWERIEG